MQNKEHLQWGNRAEESSGRNHIITPIAKITSRNNNKKIFQTCSNYIFSASTQGKVVLHEFKKKKNWHGKFSVKVVYKVVCSIPLLHPYDWGSNIQSTSSKHFHSSKQEDTTPARARQSIAPSFRHTWQTSGWETPVSTPRSAKKYLVVKAAHRARYFLSSTRGRVHCVDSVARYPITVQL